MLVFEADTHLSYVWGYDDTVITEYSSRFGSLANDAFYVLDDVTDSLVKLGESPAPAMALNLTPADPNPSSDVDPETGLIYIGPSSSAGAFQELDTATDTLSDLPSPPTIPDGYMSSVIVVRAPSAP